MPNTETVFVHPDLQLTLTEAGSGRAVLILHGGAGPFSVAPLAAHLAQRALTLMPTHPGWNGTPRPEWCTGADDLALAYLHLLEQRGLSDVLVVGSSFGGWIAAEMAVRDNARRLRGVVLIGATGIQVEGQPVRNVFELDPRELAQLSFHDAARFAVDPLTLPPEQLAMRKANLATLAVFAGGTQPHDSKLRRRLAHVTTPALVVWGESDRVVTPAYGKAYAQAFKHGRFELIGKAGHLPQLEQPVATFAAIDAFG
jgi:pimeloyl-ACP methyl ester carboxylesterase